MVTVEPDEDAGKLAEGIKCWQAGRSWQVAAGHERGELERARVKRELAEVKTECDLLKSLQRTLLDSRSELPCRAIEQLRHSRHCRRCEGCRACRTAHITLGAVVSRRSAHNRTHALKRRYVLPTGRRYGME